MAALDDLVTFVKSAVQNLGAINTSLKSVFPQQTATASTASGGAATLPTNPVGFIVVTLQNGTSVKVPYYST